MSWIADLGKKYENLMRWLDEHLPSNVLTIDDFREWCLEVIKGVDNVEDIRVKIAEHVVFKEKRGDSWSLFVAEQQVARGTGTYVARSKKSYNMVAWIAIVPVHPKVRKPYVQYLDTKTKKLIKKRVALERMEHGQRVD
jgi:hypothetical protein